MEFLELMLNKFRFPPQFNSLIMNFVISINFQVLINGFLTKSFKPERGLLQGDPSCPFPFCDMCRRPFRPVKKGGSRGTLQGIRMGTSAPEINHLFFADDSLIVVKGMEQAATGLKVILGEYAETSGQIINFQKSSMYFEKGSEEEVEGRIGDILEMGKCEGEGKYLGLPYLVGRSKKQIFQYVSMQAIPTYAMQCFLIPKGVSDEITGIAEVLVGK